jgi:exodeoxyribonuclease-1
MTLDKPLGLDSVNDMSSAVRVLRKRYGDQNIVLPFLDRFRAYLTPDQKQTVSDNHDLINKCIAAFNERTAFHIDFTYPDVPDMDPDAGLYRDGFFSHGEKKEIDRFHRADIHEKIKITASFQSSRIRTLANRILYRNFHENCPESGDEYAEHLNKIYSASGKDTVKGYRNDTKFNRALGLQEIMTIKQGLKQSDVRQLKILDDVEQYIRQLTG